MYLGQNIKQILPGNVAVGGANMGMVPLFSVQWCPSRDAIWAGYVAADGQELDDNLFPDAAAGIAANNVPTTSNANWLADPTARGAYVSGSSAGKFRVPDYNGKFAGSLGAVFLRGDGTLSAEIAGVIQPDELKSHSHTASYYNIGNQAINNGFSNPNAYSPTYVGAATPVVMNASGGGVETRPLNVTGCWVIKLFGAVTNMASADAAQLASSYASLGARINALPFTKEFVSVAQVITSGGGLTIAHGLPSRPFFVSLEFVCVVADAGYAIGDRIQRPPGGAGFGGGSSVEVWADSTNLNVRYGSGTYSVGNKTTGAQNTITLSSWRVVLRAFV